MSIIDPTTLSPHAAAVSAADEQKVKDGFGRLELAIAAIANDPAVSETDRAAALERLAANAVSLKRSLATAESIEEAITATFGSSGGPAGALAAPNSDVVAELTTAAKASLGTLGSAEAISRGLVAKGVLDGTFPVAGDQPEAVAQLTAANAAKAAAEAAKATAETALADANTAHAAVIASIKAATRDATVGGSSKKVIDVTRLSPEAKTALGLP